VESNENGTQQQYNPQRKTVNTMQSKRMGFTIMDAIPGLLRRGWLVVALVLLAGATQAEPDLTVLPGEYDWVRLECPAADRGELGLVAVSSELSCSSYVSIRFKSEPGQEWHGQLFALRPGNRIEPGEQVWLRIEGTEIGTWPVDVRYYIGDELLGQPIELTVHVPQVDLPTADIPFGCFAPLCDQYMPGIEYSDEYIRACFEDMAAHGQNSICFYDEMEKLTDRWYGPAQAFNWDAVGGRQLLMLRETLLAEQPFVILNSSLAKQPQAQEQALAELKEAGFPNALIYFIDEPSVTQHAYQLIRTMPRGPMRRVTAMRALWSAACYAPYYDVLMVQPGWPWWGTDTLRAPRSEIDDWFVMNQTELWTYDCKIYKTCDYDWERWYSGAFTWAYSLRGNMVWAYNHIGTHIWKPERSDDTEWQFNMALLSDDGPLPTVAWEGRYQGTIDYRLLKLAEQVGCCDSYLQQLRQQICTKAVENRGKGGALTGAELDTMRTNLLHPLKAQ